MSDNVNKDIQNAIRDAQILQDNRRRQGSQEVAIENKLLLTIPEAAAYSNICINRLTELLKKPRCDFVMYVGRKKLIKRKEFEKFIEKAVEI